MDGLKISTAALASGDASKGATYTALTNKILTWTDARDAIGSEMKAMLDGTAFNDEVFDEVRGRHLVDQAQGLLDEMSGCAFNPISCAQPQVATQARLTPVGEPPVFGRLPYSSKIPLRKGRNRPARVLSYLKLEGDFQLGVWHRQMHANHVFGLNGIRRGCGFKDFRRQ